MIDKKKLSLPSVLQSTERKHNTISNFKLDVHSPKQSFTHSSQFLKSITNTSSKFEEKSTKQLQVNASDFSNLNINNVVTKTERANIEKENGVALKELSILRGLPQYLSIESSAGTVRNLSENRPRVEVQKGQVKLNFSNKVGVRKQHQSMSINPTSPDLQSPTVNSPQQKSNQLNQILQGTDEQNKQNQVHQQSLLDRFYIFKRASTQLYSQSFEHTDQSLIQFNTTKELQNPSKFAKDQIDEDSKYNNSQNQTMGLSSSYLKKHHLSLQQLSLEKLMRSPIVSNDNIELKHILKDTKKNNSIHLAMKSFQINKGKKLHQFEQELGKIKDNLLSKTYFQFPAKASRLKYSNDSILTNQITPSPYQEEDKSQSNQSYINSASASQSQRFQFPNPLPNQVESESKVNQSIIKFITDKTILQEDFIREVLCSEYQEDEQNPIVNYLRKKQMHFTQNAEVVDILEQVDIHHKTLLSLGNEYQKDHQAFFKLANMDTIKKDLLAFQKSQNQKIDYKISQEREESQYLQNWLANMIDRVLKKNNQTFQQIFSEVALLQLKSF